MTLLIAGFSSFPSAPRNPTEDLARSLGNPAIRGAREIAAVTLPVEWARSWPVLREAIEARRPACVLLFGLHVRASRPRIELVARNRRELGRVDAAGGFPSGPAVLDGPDALLSRLPFAACARALRRAGIDFEWSRDAGTYLCNDTLYRLAFHADGLGVERFGFVHVPLTDESVEDFAAAGSLPDVFRSVPAASLERAALALAGVI